MQGVITRAHVLAHPIVIAEGFGMKVLVRALFAGARETFLGVVTRCAEEEAHRDSSELGLQRTVRHFIGFECRVRDLYRGLSRQQAAVPEAATFFATLARHEEGHAIVLSRVRREIRRGRLWKESKALHIEAEHAFGTRLAGYEEEVRCGVTLARALEIVEGIESAELNVVFDTLFGCVDMRSRSRFERFFVLTRKHLEYCADSIRSLRADQRIA